MHELVASLEELERFLALPREDRLRLGPAVAEALGDAWEAAPRLAGDKGLCVMRHRPTGIELVAVPGGSFEMGLRDDDLEELSEHVDWTSHVARAVRELEARCRPVHAVRVRPFLCAERPLSSEQARRLSHGREVSDTLPAGRAARFVEDLGFRLPSEAELEWLAREGGGLHFTCDIAAATGGRRGAVDVNGFGVVDLLGGEWAADGWHPSYDGAPATSAPWSGGDPRGVFRGGLPLGLEERSELLLGLAAFRSPGASPGEPDDDERFMLVRPATWLRL
ncbi:formylglycine-generating enzyme family protein [Sorangium sp. So ce406]|uniref:formylglycine-generating enzyme family protein n=1 Tax=Sorangium sp. So ce406 TaxID=3133311 RepID=UPI003F5B5020